MIKNIVLDMGNVCCKWDVSYIASQLARRVSGAVDGGVKSIAA